MPEPMIQTSLSITRRMASGSPWRTRRTRRTRRARGTRGRVERTAAFPSDRRLIAKIGGLGRSVEEGQQSDREMGRAVNRGQSPESSSLERGPEPGLSLREGDCHESGTKRVELCRPAQRGARTGEPDFPGAVAVQQLDPFTISGQPALEGEHGALEAGSTELRGEDRSRQRAQPDRVQRRHGSAVQPPGYEGQRKQRGDSQQKVAAARTRGGAQGRFSDGNAGTVLTRSTGAGWPRRRFRSKKFQVTSPSSEAGSSRVAANNPSG